MRSQTRRGPGKGWHEERRRHSLAARMGWRTRKGKMKPSYTPEQLKRIHRGRPPRARAADERRFAQRTLSPDNAYVDTWVKHPGAMDIKGIDTPPVSVALHEFIDRLRSAKSKREREEIYEAERQKAPSEQHKTMVWDAYDSVEDELRFARDAKQAGRKVRVHERKYGEGSWVADQWKRDDDDEPRPGAMYKNLEMPQITPALKTIRQEEMAGNFVSDDHTRLYIPQEAVMDKPAFVKKFEQALKDDTIHSFTRVDDPTKRFVRYNLGGKKQRVFVDRAMEAEIFTALGGDTKAYPIDSDTPVLYKGEHGYAMLAPRIVDE